MARQRDVVTKKLNSKQLHEDAIKRCIKLYSPHEVVHGDLLGEKYKDRYYVVFTAPLGADREVLNGYRKRSKAVRSRNRHNRSWAQGFWASGMA